AELARRRGVPLYLVGLGDPRPPRELQLELGELPDVVLLKDRIVFAGQVTGQGDDLPGRVDVVLYEKAGEQRKELKREAVPRRRRGTAAPSRRVYSPETPGDKVFVLVPAPGPPAAGQRPVTAAEQERVIHVADLQQIRVLYLEGRPRYEYRFVKTLLERELARDKAAKSVALRTLLFDADKGFEKVDESAQADFPTENELFGFNVVIVGDVAPEQLGERAMRQLVEFVRRGGGLLFVAGEDYNPRAYRDTPLAAVLPLTWDVESAA